MQRSSSARSLPGRYSAVESPLAIDMYGYGLAAARVAATERLTPRSARAYPYSPYGTPRASRWSHAHGPLPLGAFHARSASRSPPGSRSTIVPAGSQWSLRPKQKLDLRAQLSVGSQNLMEVAHLSFLQAADLVAADDRSSCGGLVNVHEAPDLDSALVTTLEAHTRLYTIDSCQLDDGSKRVLIVLEGEDAPLGWSTALTPDGLPLIYLYARPLYEVTSLPLKVRQDFDQSSRFRKQLAVGTRLHIIDTRRTNDGAQRVNVIVIGEEEPVGWVTARKLDGTRTLKEVSLEGPSSSAWCGSSTETRYARYASTSDDALEQAALEFVSQEHTYMSSDELQANEAEVLRKAVVVVNGLQAMVTSFLDGGSKPLAVQLGEIFQERPFSLQEMMQEAETAGSSPEVTGKISKMEFRMYIRRRLDKVTMLSSSAGAEEIDALFPTLDKNGDGEMNVHELESALVMLENSRAEYEAKVTAYRKRDEKYKAFASNMAAVLAATVKAEEAFHARRQVLKQSVGPQLGTLIATKGWSAPQIAAMWVPEGGRIERAAFRREALAIGLEAEPSSIDTLFDSICDGGSMDAMELEQALVAQQEIAEAMRPKFRRVHIDVIEGTKEMRAEQAKHRVSMAEWAIFMTQEQERHVQEQAEEAHIQGLSKAQKTKRNTLGNAHVLGKSGKAAGSRTPSPKPGLQRQPSSSKGPNVQQPPAADASKAAAHAATPSMGASMAALGFLNKLKKKKKAEPDAKASSSEELRREVDEMVAKRDAEVAKVAELSKIRTFKIAVGESLLASNAKVSDMVKIWATNAKGAVGEISKMDFRKHIRKVVDWTNVKDIDAFFCEVDGDGGGMLDSKELTTAVKKLQDETRVKLENISKSQDNVEWFKPRIDLIKKAIAETSHAEQTTRRVDYLSANKGVGPLLGAQLVKRGTKIGDLVSAWDSTNNEINKKQWRKNLAKFGIEAPDDDMDRLFDELDLDGGGSLGLDEMKAALTKLRETSAETDRELTKLKKDVIELWKVARAAQAEWRKCQKADVAQAALEAEQKAEGELARAAMAAEAEAAKRAKVEATRKAKEEEAAAYEAKIQERRAQLKAK